MQLVIQLVDMLISYLFWKAKMATILFLNYLFSRLKHFCCQAMHSTFYLLPLFYVFLFFFSQLLKSGTKILLFSDGRRVQI